ncbi:hypothetical protein BHE74_00006656 [Ensete ventricosum]|uniref:Uncharacterized protein n=1 Tax=Ensete ventricosum TaxID=4639 RepID=A0A427AXI4_ENSVE|nr:hypothetical protein B296_00002089 [Ensete ventricosum]RWV95524.1 hypothetical protein GW17_00041846 [Ensete ventricosum]RWW84720.1 hypothetical protein BHE74_00006656 [Ensete ventricosum]RZR79963.1 hypothetical protein BHM03_00005841 [Ensete ventricosum]
MDYGERKTGAGRRLDTDQDAGGEGVRGPALREGAESHLGRRMLRLPQRGAEARALEHLAVEVHRRLEPRRMIRPLPYARVRRQVEAAPLRQLLQLVLVHPRRSSRNPQQIPAEITVRRSSGGRIRPPEPSPASRTFARSRSEEWQFLLRESNPYATMPSARVSPSSTILLPQQQEEEDLLGFEAEKAREEGEDSASKISSHWHPHYIYYLLN